MKGGSRSVSRRMVVAFFVLLYRAQASVPSSGMKSRFQNFTGHPFSTPGICGFICLKGYPGCSGNGVRSFVNRKQLICGRFCPLLAPPPLFRKATGLLNTVQLLDLTILPTTLKNPKIVLKNRENRTIFDFY